MTIDVRQAASGIDVHLDRTELDVFVRAASSALVNNRCDDAGTALLAQLGREVAAALDRGPGKSTADPAALKDRMVALILGDF